MSVIQGQCQMLFAEPSLTDIRLTLCIIMMTSSNWSIFSVTGLLWGEYTGHRWIPLTKAIDAELGCFLWSAPEQTFEQTTEAPVIWDAILSMCLFPAAHLYYNDVTPTLKRLKSPTIQLFVQKLALDKTKQNIKISHHWPFVMVIHRWSEDALTNG